MKKILLILSLAIAPTILWAEPLVIPPPKKPFVHRTPAFASWTISLDRSNPSANPGVSVDSPRTVTVVKTNKTYWEQITMQSGSKSERWIYNGLELKTDPSTGAVVYVPQQEDPSLGNFNFRTGDFDKLSWLSDNNYQGIKKYKDVECYYFDSSPTKTPNPAARKSVAYLTTDTQLPLFSSNGWINCSYTYNDPPTQALVPPEKFLKVFQQLEITVNQGSR